MSPTEALAALTDVSKVLEFGKLLDQGTPAIIDVIIDLTDDFISQSIPAVAAAKQACAALPDCQDTYKKIEHDLGRRLMKETGIWSIVDKIVRIWRSVPAAARFVIENVQAMVGRARAIVSTALDVINDPVKYLMEAKQKAVDWLTDHSFGVVSLMSAGKDEVDKILKTTIGSIPGASLVKGFDDAVDSVLSKLGPVGSALSTVAHIFNPFSW